MHTHALTVALTLYRSGTLTLEQAAESAGVSVSEMRTAVRRYGIALREAPSPTVEAGPSLSAD
jgi:predicted HTH domain antitoxin